MSNTGWMSKAPLGSLASEADKLPHRLYDSEFVKNPISAEKKVLLEDFRSGLISVEELQLELKALK